MKRITENDLYQIVHETISDFLTEGVLGEFGNDSSNDYEFIGTFQSLVEYDSDLSFVGEDKIGKYESFTVYVYPRDNGYIPHVHILLTKEIGSSKKSFDCCVKLETNEYFQHGPHQSTMISRQCKDFNTFMHSMKTLRKVQMTHYEYAVDRWDDNSERIKVNVKEDENGNLIIPNYSIISE